MTAREAPSNGPLDTGPLQAYIGPQGVCTVPRVYGQDKPESEGKRAFLLEFIAAFGILSVMALVLYMVLTYKPA